MSKITNDGLSTWIGKGCFSAIAIWQHGRQRVKWTRKSISKYYENAREKSTKNASKSLQKRINLD